MPSLWLPYGRVMEPKSAEEAPAAELEAMQSFDYVRKIKDLHFSREDEHLRQNCRPRKACTEYYVKNTQEHLIGGDKHTCGTTGGHKQLI